MPHLRMDGVRRPATTPARFAARRPRLALLAWLLVAGVLALVGRDVGSALHGTSVRIGGSESAKARSLAASTFQDEATVPVLLQGPAKAVDAQGRALVARLSRERGVLVMSPWSAGAAASTPLRPEPGTVLVIASVTGSADAVRTRAREVEDLARRAVHGPVQAHVTGLDAVSRDGVRSSLRAVHRAELIALPVLLLVLLLVFRAPLAALLPVAFGATTILASTGVLRLLAGVLELDAFATSIATMMGLALAVDYALLVVSRTREERAGLAPGDDPALAVHRAAAPTSRTIVVAGAAIVVAMAAAAALAPGASVLSAAVGVSAVAALSALGAALVMPAALVLLGDRLDLGRRRVPAREPRAGRVPGRGAAAVVALALLALSVPAFGLDTAAPGAGALPDDSRVRADTAAVTEALGAGWSSPFELVAVARTETMTTPKRLAALQRLQRRLERDPEVAAVLGPGTIAPQARRLRRAGQAAVDGQRKLTRSLQGRTRKLADVDRGVSTAASGAAALQGALSSAGSAAGSLDSGSRKVAGGVGQLRGGIDGTAAGARRLARRLSDAGSGSKDLASGAGRAATSAGRLRDGLQALRTALTSVRAAGSELEARLRRRRDAVVAVRDKARAQDQHIATAVDELERALPTSGVAALRSRVALRKVRDALAQADAPGELSASVDALDRDARYAGVLSAAVPGAEVNRLATGAARVVAGLGSLKGEVSALGGAVSALAGGSGELVEALQRLGSGAEDLGAGVERLRDGAAVLRTGVGDGARTAGSLSRGLDAARSAASGLGGDAAPSGGGARATPGDAAKPSFFESGYFLLAALQSEGKSPYGVDVARGGRGARILVVPRHSPDDPRTIALYDRLRGTAAGLRSSIGADAAVGGPAALLLDYDQRADARLPVLVVALALLTAVLLGVLLRSVVVPLIGIALNLLTVGASLGLLQLLFAGDDPLLGGPGHLDAVAVTAVFGIIFALSIDYQVFIVARVREEFLRTGDASRAVAVGLARTRAVVTGAALSMLGVFLALGLADIATLRQFGVGLAIAVALDATVVRLVLLPVCLRAAGRWAWWLPGRPHVAGPQDGTLRAQPASAG
ncbi:MMPL family transporter [Conexibacter sp. SYSU D00693]|uniref:MMPL family transporter n=1 Tax=Conexibacter sp. SYSU D00693 TaxID=2812560 RepID=UPI00196A3580|nr:MMPL family transporter [Conexibacter sp. SYSU D00693]